MNRYVTILAALGVVLAAPAVHAAAATAPTIPEPSYRWLEAAYAFNYCSFCSGGGDQRLKSDAGFRIAANYELIDHLVLVGAYDYQDFNGPELKFADAGLGTHFGVYRSTDWFLNATWETQDMQNLSNGTSIGWGAQTGFRMMLTRYGEISVAYKYSEFKDHAVKDSYDTFAGGLTLPLSHALDVTMRVENVNRRHVVRAVGTSNDDMENYLIGLRARF